MPMCDFNKDAKQFCLNRTSACVFSSKFDANFQILFSKSTYGGLLLSPILCQCSRLFQCFQYSTVKIHCLPPENIKNEVFSGVFRGYINRTLQQYVGKHQKVRTLAQNRVRKTYWGTRNMECRLPDSFHIWLKVIEYRTRKQMQQPRSVFNE